MGACSQYSRGDFSFSTENYGGQYVVPTYFQHLFLVSIVLIKGYHDHCGILRGSRAKGTAG